MFKLPRLRPLPMREDSMSELKVIMLKGKSWLVPADMVTGEYMDGLPATDSDGMGIEYIVTIKRAKPEKVRTTKQQAGIEVYCRQCAAKCVEGGLDVKAVIAKFRSSTSIPMSQELFKATVFKVIQLTMFGIESTTKPSTTQINDIYMVVNRFTSERLGFSIPWPSNRSD